MIRLYFAIYDAASKIFMEPFQARTIEEAIRRFRATVNHRDAGSIREYPEDYTLFHIGEYDMETGKLTALETPHSLGLAITFVDRKGLDHGEQQSLHLEVNDAS